MRGDGRVVGGGGEFLGVGGRGVTLGPVLGMLLLLGLVLRSVEVVGAGGAVVVTGVVGRGGLLVVRVGGRLRGGLGAARDGRTGVGDVLVGWWWRSCCSVGKV